MSPDRNLPCVKYRTASGIFRDGTNHQLPDLHFTYRVPRSWRLVRYGTEETTAMTDGSIATVLVNDRCVVSSGSGVTHVPNSLVGMLHRDRQDVAAGAANPQNGRQLHDELASRFGPRDLEVLVTDPASGIVIQQRRRSGLQEITRLQLDSDIGTNYLSPEVPEERPRIGRVWLDQGADADGSGTGVNGHWEISVDGALLYFEVKEWTSIQEARQWAVTRGEAVTLRKVVSGKLVEEKLFR